MDIVGCIEKQYYIGHRFVKKCELTVTLWLCSGEHKYDKIM